MIIAVDGPAASGKGTISTALAAHYGLPHLDTGLLYRAVGAAVLDKLDHPDLEELATESALNLDTSTLDPVRLGAPDIATAAAKIARFDSVRQALRKVQHDFAHQDGGAVLDGRDIGTRIAPEAEAKLFITASTKARTNRRWRQLTGRGEAHLEREIEAQIIARDESDRSNPAGAFYQAEDAHLLDTTDLDIEAAIRAAIAIVDAATTGKGE